MTATMYAPYSFTFHDSTGEQPRASPYMQHPMHMSETPENSTAFSNSPPPNTTVSSFSLHSGPSRLRAKRAPDASKHRSNTLEVSVDTYDSTMGLAPTGPPKLGGSVVPARAKPVSDEEARKARKREMGRERQRRKRLRDKEKREAAKLGTTDVSVTGMGGNIHQVGDHMPASMYFELPARGAGSRASLAASTSSFETLPSSASSTYSSLPTAPGLISPVASFPMSATSSLSDSSSPGHAFSPSLPSSASSGALGLDPAWQEHTAVFGNLNLNSDATIRAKPRPNSSSLVNISAPRRASGVELQSVGITVERPSPAKRRKSDSRPDGGVVGVMIDPQLEGVGVWNTKSPERRKASAPSGAMGDSPERSPTPPPPIPELPAGTSSGNTKPTPEGLFFASSLCLAVNQTEWAGILQSKLGVTKRDLELMGPDLATAFDKWRIQNGMSMASASPVSPIKPMALQMQSQHGHVTAPLKSPSGSSSNSDSMSHGGPSGTPSLSQSVRLNPAPETPNKPSGPTSSSSSTSPANPSLHTPLSGHGSFPHHEMPTRQWATSSTVPQPARLYEVEWRPQYQPLSSPITHHGKGDHHLGPMAPAPAQCPPQQPILGPTSGPHGHFVHPDYSGPAVPRANVSSMHYGHGGPVPPPRGNNYVHPGNMPVMYNQAQHPLVVQDSSSAQHHQGVPDPAFVGGPNYPQ